jgi:hypothetical protein
MTSRQATLALLVSAILLTFLACRTSHPGPRVDRRLGAYVSSEATAIAGINLEELKRSVLYQQYASLLNRAGLNAAAQEAGLDPRRDLTSLLIFLDNDQPELLLQGSFSSEAVTRELLARGARASSYNGRTLLEGVRLSKTAQAIFFPKNDIAAVGSLPMLHRTIDGSGGGIPDDLQAGVRTLPPDDQIWFAMKGTIPTGQLTSRSDIGSMLTSLAGFVDGAAGGIRFDSGIRVKLDLSCLSENSAQQVRDAFRAVIGLAGLGMRDNQKELLPIYDAIHVAEEGRAVHVQMDVTPELSEKLLSHLQN